MPKRYVGLSLLFAVSLSAKIGNTKDEAGSPKSQQASFKVPEGFVVELVASEENGLINPIDITFDDAGKLWTQTALMYPLDAVGDMPWNDLMKLMENPSLKANYPEFERIKKYYQLKTKGEDKILVIDNPTGTIKGQIPVFAEGLTIPQSILPYKDGAFVAHGSEMLFLDDTNKDGKYDTHKTVLTGFGFNDTHTMSHTLVRGPGGWVHFSQGALNEGQVTAVASGESTKIAYSKIAKFSLDGNKIEVTNTAANNMWGFQLRSTGQWYASEANDRGFCVTPMDPFMAVMGIGNKKQREYQPWTPRMHKFGVGGTGISGLAFDENGKRGFPAEWQNVAFIANPLTNALNAVHFERLADGSVKSKHLPDFLKSTDKWFRPVNIEFGPDGCLYIADWYNEIIAHNETARSDPRRDRKHGRIWRVRHISQKPAAIPNLIKVRSTDLVKHLSAEILWEKRAAWHQIAVRQAKELIPQLITLAAEKEASLSTRVHALWSLESLKHFDKGLMYQLLTDSAYDIRSEALRSLVSFNLTPEVLSPMIKPLIEDKHHMVRAQVLRTLDALEKSSVELIEILVSGSKKEHEGNKLGGAFERRFERFLARKAMEKYPSELTAFFNSPLLNQYPTANQLWALLALPDKEKEVQFLKLWDTIKDKEIADETLISILSMVDNPLIYKSIEPHFRDENKSKTLLKKMVQYRSQLKQPKKNVHRYAVDSVLVYPKELISLLSNTLSELFDTGSDADKLFAIDVAYDFRSGALNNKISKALAADVTNSKLHNKGLKLLIRNTAKNGTILNQVASHPEIHMSTRLKAMSALFIEKHYDKKKSRELYTAFFHNKSKAELATLVSTLSQSSQGLMVMLKLYQDKLIDESSFDDTSIMILTKITVRNKTVWNLYDFMKKRTANKAISDKEKIAKYTKAVETLKGNPVIGKGFFQSCLACHQVGGKGQEIAPPLDGSATRDMESLLASIVTPNAAVEGGYYLQAVLDQDGDIFQGYLFKQDSQGTTIALMGGEKVFISKSDIRAQTAVSGNSFMPSHFGELPEQLMVDLISYIKTELVVDKVK